MEPTSPAADRGALVAAWPALVSLFGAMLVALIAENAAVGIGFFIWMMVNDTGRRRQVFGQRTETLWPLTTTAAALAVAGILKLTF